MPFVKAQCTSCGAALDVDPSKDAAVCPYCNTPYVVEKAINKYNVNITNNINAQTVNIFNQKDDFEIVAGVLKRYTGKATDITIPDEVISIESGALPKGITSVIINDSSSIGYLSGFSDLENLKHISLGNSITIIGDNAFGGCQSLTDVVIPESVIRIGNSAFANCNSLISITIPDSVAEIDYGAFSYCKNLKYVTIGKSVTSIGSRAFSYCKSLKSIIIPQSVTSINDYTFECCENLTNVAISSFTTISKNAFFDCKNLKSKPKAKGIFSLLFHRNSKRIK